MDLIRTNSENIDFIKLVKLLDLGLQKTDGDEYSFYAQFNKLDSIKHVAIVYENKIPVGCGAIKQFDEKTMEIKRMFTSPNYRGKGIASLILGELEKWATELSFHKCILETGVKQPDAIGLYYKNGYELISNYSQYKGAINSICFEKVISRMSN